MTNIFFNSHAHTELSVWLNICTFSSFFPFLYTQAFIDSFTLTWARLSALSAVKWNVHQPCQRIHLGHVRISSVRIQLVCKRMPFPESSIMPVSALVTFLVTQIFGTVSVIQFFKSIFRMSSDVVKCLRVLWAKQWKNSHHSSLFLNAES